MASAFAFSALSSSESSGVEEPFGDSESSLSASLSGGGAAAGGVEEAAGADGAGGDAAGAVDEATGVDGAVGFAGFAELAVAFAGA